MSDDLITVSVAGPDKNVRCLLCLKYIGTSNACTGCRSGRYCSKECQKADWPVHKLLCGSFKRFSASKRPSLTKENHEHVRGILFPVDESKPRFIWIRTNPQDPQQRIYSEYSGDANLKGGSNVRNFNGSEVSCDTQPLWLMFDIDYKRSMETLNRSILHLGPPGLGYPWHGPVIACGEGDVNMADFRAIVDFFVLHPSNKALLDPFRYFGPPENMVRGVRLNSEGMIKTYELPQMDGVVMTKAMLTTPKTPSAPEQDRRMRLQGIGRLLELPLAWHPVNEFPHHKVPNADSNPAAYIISVSRQLESAERGDEGKAFGDYGSVIISRLDNKQVFALHVEAWHELLFYNSQDAKQAVIQASDAADEGVTGQNRTRKPIDMLKKTINKQRFIEFWPLFLNRHRYVDGELDERPSPYEV